MMRTAGDYQRHLMRFGVPRESAILMVPPDGWLDACGSLVGQPGRQAAFDLLVGEGCDPGETSLVLTVVAREIEHDEPERAQQYLRSWLPAGGSETLLMRTLATLVAPQ